MHISSNVNGKLFMPNTLFVDFDVTRGVNTVKHEEEGPTT